jgi:hypothetical protein
MFGYGYALDEFLREAYLLAKLVQGLLAFRAQWPQLNTQWLELLGGGE